MTLRLELLFKQCQFYFLIRWFTFEYNVVSFGVQILYYFLCNLKYTWKLFNESIVRYNPYDFYTSLERKILTKNFEISCHISNISYINKHLESKLLIWKLDF